jgi:hypothetical protein
MERKNRLPVPTSSGDSVALRDLPRRKSRAKSGDGGGVGDRGGGGLQRLPFQFGPRGDDLAFAFLESFVKQFLRNAVSEDMIIFAMYGVKADMKATDEQMKVFQAAILGWWKQNKFWPDGF